MKFQAILLIAILFSSNIILSQTDQNEIESDKEKVQQTINQFIEALNTGDRSKMESTLHFSLNLLTIYKKDDRSMIIEESKDDLLFAITSPRTNVWKEEIISCEIQLEGDLAQVWAHYTFYLDGKILHCGIDAFQLFKSPDGWKIIQITDTRRKENCN